eukprot:scaffold57300_cov69-Phaeocystis_antarctica.AAC.6
MPSSPSARPGIILSTPMVRRRGSSSARVSMKIHPCLPTSRPFTWKVTLLSGATASPLPGLMSAYRSPEAFVSKVSCCAAWAAVAVRMAGVLKAEARAARRLTMQT